MKILMFYSYKGGSGRTVAAANVAAALAKIGKRVAIIDLDFEAPGLQQVFGVDQTASSTSGLGIQSYLKGDISFSELRSVATIDILKEFGNKSVFERPRVPKDAKLLFIVASTRVTLLDASDPDVGDRMKALAQALENEGIEYLLIDAASGIREAFSIALDACHEILVFFRWSKQHVAGAIRMVEFLKSLRKRRRDKPFRLIASATPDELEFTHVTDERLRDELIGIKSDTKKIISEKLKECDIDPPEVFYDIPEFLEMKWREGIVVFRDSNSPYEALALKLAESDIPITPQ